jgi:hypothetical protein
MIIFQLKLYRVVVVESPRRSRNLNPAQAVRLSFSEGATVAVLFCEKEALVAKYNQLQM